MVGTISGWIAVVVLIASWIAQSEVALVLQTRVKTPYDRAFAITFFNHATLLLCLPVAIIQQRFQRKQRDQGCCFGFSWGSNAPRLPPPSPRSSLVYGEAAPLLDEAKVDDKEPAWPLLAKPRRMAAAVLLLAVLYIVSDYAWYRALGVKGFSVTEGTALYNSSAAFVFGFSVCLLRERVTVPKVIALLLSMAGVAGTAVASARVEPEPGGSNLLVPALTVVCAAALYALYEVSFTKLVSQGRSLKAYEVNLVCGLIGVAHIVFIPIFPLLDVLDIEKFILPTQAQWPLLLLNAGLALAFNWSLLIALAALGPVVVSVAVLSTIPLSAITDSLAHHAVTYTALSISGYVMIAAGFALMVWANSRGIPAHKDGQAVN